MKSKIFQGLFALKRVIDKVGRWENRNRNRMGRDRQGNGEVTQRVIAKVIEKVIAKFIHKGKDIRIDLDIIVIDKIE